MDAERRKALQRVVKDFEARGVPAEICAAAGRIINKCERNYHGKDLDFTVALKVVVGQPKFLTFTFHQPASAAFIFFTYGDAGKRYFNRKIFEQMAEYLDGAGQVETFTDMLETQPFAA